jgi:hypothetical protein
MITVDDIGFLAKKPKAPKRDRFGTPTCWLWVGFRTPTGSGILYLNVVTTGDTAVAAAALAEGVRVRVLGALDSRRFGWGDDTQFVIVVQADEVTPESAAEKTPATADRKPRS